MRIDEASKVLRCLAEPTRLKILLVLAERGELFQKQLIATLDRPQGSVARHLGHLLRCGLVSVRKVGRYTYWSGNRVPDDVLGLLDELHGPNGGGGDPRCSGLPLAGAHLG